ncbi:hypothetical protein EI427_11475 [Flammeovirga pectinis]|uniref:Uncharacterized protein n=1 Tax=Flammeovirga pectinis TaxID=2494373 RepID=A0A3Q9FQC6_9BACT|nr:hypothetical protein [Flammeovirga pectinis]AZQ62831.1 hypothetical protein EI427_11475 [Flammeovirga pectinis]
MNDIYFLYNGIIRTARTKEELNDLINIGFVALASYSPTKKMVYDLSHKTPEQLFLLTEALKNEIKAVDNYGINMY